MIDNKNDIDDFGDDNQDDFDREKPERTSFRDTWDSNPLLKIAAVVLGISVLLGGYITFFAGEGEKSNRSQIGKTALVDVKTDPTKNPLDPEYQAAIEAENRKRAEQAMKSQASSMPTPTGASSEGGIDIDMGKNINKDDPLADWRARAEAERLEQQRDSLPEDELTAGTPEIVPMVQPVRPQPVIKMDPEAAKALNAQMRVIVAAQAPQKSRRIGITSEMSEYSELKAELAAQKQAGATGASAIKGFGAPVPADKKATKKVIATAGSISYAQLINELNSDVEGPVLAHILSGPFTGGRALGEFSTEGEFLVIKFSRIIKDGVSYAVNGIALDEKTTLAAHQTDVDYHYFTRIILPAAAKFVEGYGSALAETGTSTTTTNGGGVVQDQPEPSEEEALYKGLEEASSKASEVLDEGADRPITVKVAKGTTMGILFMDEVSTASAGK